MVNSSHRHGRLVVLAVLVVGLMAVPVAAVAASTRPKIAVAKKCYLQNVTIPVSGSGFVPRRAVELRLGGRKKSTIADRNGRIKTAIRTPHIAGHKPRQLHYRLKADERGHTSREPRSVPVRITSFGVSLRPNRNIHKGQRIRYRFSGFTHGGTVYAHYALNGTLMGNARLGRLTGACGNLRTRAEVIPRRLWAAGNWVVQYDTDPVYSRSTRTYLRLSLTTG